MSRATPSRPRATRARARRSTRPRSPGATSWSPTTGEWLQQATLAIRTRVPLDILIDTIQPFPTFSEIHLAGLKALHREIATARRVAEVAS
jgi:hypothetical protein